MPLSHPPEELSAWLRLSLEPGIGPVTARELLQAFGLPEQIYALDADVLASTVPPALARQLSTPPSDDARALIDRTLQWVSAPANRILTLSDPDYPAALLEMHDPPVLLYLIGDTQLLARPTIAMVGARSATPDGISNARAFARHLALQGWCVASGLALGIDAAAHEGALEAGSQGGGTVAVIGTGADIVYPARNRALAHRIAAGGALLSELPLGTPAIAHHFPRRNRLVAGLARGVLVVEAAMHSGSLITARLAADMGREVFAIPGSIHSPLSRGCHALIRQGAKLVETADDILVELGTQDRGAAAARSSGSARAVDRRPEVDSAAGSDHPGLSPGKQHGGNPASPPPAAMPPATDSAERQAPPSTDPLLAAMGYGPIQLDDLLARSGLAAHGLQARLLELELAGAVARLPGGRYQICSPQVRG